MMSTWSSAIQPIATRLDLNFKAPFRWLFALYDWRLQNISLGLHYVEDPGAIRKMPFEMCHSKCAFRKRSIIKAKNLAKSRQTFCLWIRCKRMGVFLKISDALQNCLLRDQPNCKPERIIHRITFLVTFCNSLWAILHKSWLTTC